MSSEKNLTAELQLCQNVCCPKELSDRIFWKKEIDNQYQFYIASLRAEQDAKYLIQEHSNILCQTKEAEAENIELRKEIRLLQTELFVMSQRNAHDSAVIDGLQEADFEIGETNQIKSELHRKIDIKTVEGNHEDTLAEMLKEQISLLKRKDIEDTTLTASLKPLDEQLKKMLAEEKLKTHQQGMKFKNEFELVLQEFEKRNADLDVIVNEKSSAIKWATEIFSSMYGSETNVQQSATFDDEASSVESSQETERFSISAQEEYPDKNDLDNHFKNMKEEYSEYIAKKELLDSKNLVNLHVLQNCLQRFTESMKCLSMEYLSVFTIVTEIAFMKEYWQRLDAMRKKKDVKTLGNTTETALRLDQLSVIYDCLVEEKHFLETLLEYFTVALPEDFQAHCVVLQKTEELFDKSEPLTEA